MMAMTIISSMSVKPADCCVGAVISFERVTWLGFSRLMVSCFIPHDLTTHS